jgi:hypothetical protein
MERRAGGQFDRGVCLAAEGVPSHGGEGIALADDVAVAERQFVSGGVFVEVHA